MTGKRSGRVIVPRLATTAVLVAGTSLMTSCAGEEEQVAYCVDKNDQVVDEDLCDEDSDGAGTLWFFMVGNYNSGLQPGEKLDRNQGTRVNPKDSSAREKAGLPGKGKVSAGKSGTYFKPGGFGSGGKGSSS